MSTDPSSIHPDWLQPPPRPGMSNAAKVFVGLGIAGGLVSLTACAAVIMGLIQREHVAELPPTLPAELTAGPPHQHPAALPHPPATSPDRFLMPPQGTSPDTRAHSPADSRVLDAARTALEPQVVIRMKLFELNRQSAARPDNQPAGASADEKALLASLLGLSDSRRSAVLDGLEPDKLEAAMQALNRQGLVRVLSEPTLATVSGRKGTIAIGGEVSLPGPASGRGDSSGKPESYRYGTIIDALPVVLDDGRVRIEVTPAFREVAEDDSSGNPPRLVLSSQGVTAVAVMRRGQALAVAGLPRPAPAPAEVQPLRDPAQQFLLLSVEVAHPAAIAPAPALEAREATATDASPGPALPALRATASEPVPAASPALGGRDRTRASGSSPLPSPVSGPVSPRLVRPLLPDEGLRRTERTDRQPSLQDRLKEARDRQPAEPSTPAADNPVALADLQATSAQQNKIRVLQEVVAELFPRCEVKLKLAEDALIVDGRARDAAEAGQIVTVVRDATRDLGPSKTPLKLIDRLRTTDASPPEQNPAADPIAARGRAGVAAAVGDDDRSDRVASRDLIDAPLPAGSATPSPTVRPAGPSVPLGGPQDDAPQARPVQSDGFRLPGLIDRLKAVKLPIHRRSTAADSDAPGVQ